MVGLIIKTPLTDDQIRASILHSLDHVRKLLFLVLPEFLIFLHTGDIKLVLRLGARGLERACQDG